MENQSSDNGFEIRNGRIPILLALKPIKELKPHEEIVESDLRGIIKALERDPVLRHPIIADSTTGAVLDGTHRLAALSRLDCLTIPAALIDYQNPLVQVDRWFRTIIGQDVQKFVNGLRHRTPIVLTPSEAEDGLRSRSSYASLRDETHCFSLMTDIPDPHELCRAAFRLEKEARKKNLMINYTDNGDIQNLPVPGRSFLMSTIRLEKSEVVKSGMENAPFPPKSTRHLIPSRPLGINFSLEWLKDANIAKAEIQFEKHLSSKKVKILPEGSLVGSRRYMEQVFLFE